MNFDNIKNTIKNFVNTNSPEITLVGGTLAIIAGTILIARATKKADPILAEHKETVKTIHEFEYKDSDTRAKDLKKTYFHTGLKLAKVYAPGVILETAGLSSIFVSHGILKKREKALAGAYTALATSFAAYRDKVKEKLGIDEEAKIFRGTTTTKIDKDGTKVETGIETVSCDQSLYSKKFCREQELEDGTKIGSFRWTDSFDANYWMLKNAQTELNRLLKLNKVVTLNEAYQLVGLPRTDEGQVLGWIFTGSETINELGDNEIKLGLEYLDTIMDNKESYAPGTLPLEYMLTFNIDRAPIFGRVKTARWHK